MAVKGRARSAAARAAKPAAKRGGALAALESAAARAGGPLVLAAMAAHAALFTAIAAYKYRHFLFTDFDLAIFAHAVSQMLRGTLYESIGGMPWMAGHFAPVMALLAPFWLLARHPLVLLAAQAVALAGAAWPLRSLARRETGSELAATVLPLLWLLHPALAGIDLFEFHPECVAVPALLFCFDALRAGRLRAMAAWAVLALLTREDAGFVVLAMALLALPGRRPGRVRAAALLAGLAVAALVTAFGVVMPRLGSGQTDYAALYGPWGHSLREVMATLVREPGRALASLLATPGDPQDTALKRLYPLHLLLPLGFLPLASPVTLLAATPVVLEHLLSSRLTEHAIAHHYTALVLPFVGAAAAVGLGNLQRRGGTGMRPAWLAWAAVASAFSVATFGPFAGPGPLRGLALPEPLRADDETRALEPWRNRFLARVPRTGGVVAGFELLPRFTGREQLHTLHHLLAGHYTFSKRPYATPEGVTAILADLGTGSLFKWVDAGTPARWADLAARNGLHPVDSADDLVLWTRTSADTAELWTTGEPARALAKPVTYDGQVAFAGSDVLTPRVAPGERATFRTWWRRVAATPRLFLTEIVLTGPDGRPVRELWRYLGYMTHPVNGWPADASVGETYRLVIPAGSPPGRYHVGMRLWWRDRGQGICEPDDPQARAQAGYVEVAAFDVGAARR